MAAQTGFWDRMQDQMRSGYERTRRSTSRAVRIGILRVDLLSLRRDRTRALAQLGERAYSLWNAGSLGAFESDPDALRVRSLLEGIERCIASKEAELAALRSEAEESGDSRPFESASGGEDVPDAAPGASTDTRLSGSDSGGPRPPRMEGTNGIT
jgi:hypothetical protein